MTMHSDISGKHDDDAHGRFSVPSRVSLVH